MSNKIDPLASVPEALKPVYTTPNANTDISLYEGALNLYRDGVKFVGHGKVRVAWFPRPRIAFEVQLETVLRTDLLEGNTKVELVEKWPNELIDVNVTGMSLPFPTHPTTASGEIHGWKLNPHAAVQRILFHLPNFRDYRGEVVGEGLSMWTGRACLSFGEWEIVIDQGRRSNELLKELKATAGFGLTHVASLVRRDGGPFSLMDAECCLDGLYWFLSFCTGRWTGPLLHMGYDQDSNLLSHQWSMPRLSPYRTVGSWFTDQHRNVLSDAYPGFAAKWSDTTCVQAIKSAVYWYCLANAPGVAIENGVILTQVAFETIAWALFVEDLKSLSANGFNKLTFADKLRRVLIHCGIPLNVPDELPALKGAAQTENWIDGPGSVSAVRNAHVHPGKKSRERLARAGHQAEYDAWNLSLHYLELILLRLFNYHGQYSNRLITGVYKGQEVRQVPWAP
jgi:hypothetical protein